MLSGTGRYVRMYGTQRATPYGYSLFAFEVYAKVVRPPLEVSIGAGVAIRWLTENGVVYQVQWASELLGESTVHNHLCHAVPENFRDRRFFSLLHFYTSAATLGNDEVRTCASIRA